MLLVRSLPRLDTWHALHSITKSWAVTHMHKHWPTGTKNDRHAVDGNQQDSTSEQTVGDSALPSERLTAGRGAVACRGWPLKRALLKSAVPMLLRTMGLVV